MKKTKFVKLLLVALMVVMIGIIGTEVFAAEGDYDALELDDLLNNVSAENKTDSKPENKVDNTAKNTTLNTNEITNSSTSNKTTNTTNTADTLPKTGVESSVGMVVLITVCGISAVYAFKKVRDYKSL